MIEQTYDPDRLASLADFHAKYSIDQAAPAAPAAPAPVLTEINLPPCPYCGANNVVDLSCIPALFWACCCECGGHTAGTPIVLQPAAPAPVPMRTVRIPTMAGAVGSPPAPAVRIATLAWVCPVCGGPRGEPSPSIYFHGPPDMTVDGWANPCGHTDYYAVLRGEADAQLAAPVVILTPEQLAAQQRLSRECEPFSDPREDWEIALGNRTPEQRAADDAEFDLWWTSRTSAEDTE